MAPQRSKAFKILFIAVGGLATVLLIFTILNPSKFNPPVPTAQEQVATAMVREYNLAKESGSAADRCVHAGMVAESFLQADNSTQYAQWKQIQSADCSAAGVRLP